MFNRLKRPCENIVEGELSALKLPWGNVPGRACSSLEICVLQFQKTLNYGLKRFTIEWNCERRTLGRPTRRELQCWIRELITCTLMCIVWLNYEWIVLLNDKYGVRRDGKAIPLCWPWPFCRSICRPLRQEGDKRQIVFSPVFDDISMAICLYPCYDLTMGRDAADQNSMKDSIPM